MPDQILSVIAGRAAAKRLERRQASNGNCPRNGIHEVAHCAKPFRAKCFVPLLEDWDTLKGPQLDPYRIGIKAEEVANIDASRPPSTHKGN